MIKLTKLCVYDGGWVLLINKKILSEVNTALHEITKLREKQHRLMASEQSKLLAAVFRIRGKGSWKLEDQLATSGLSQPSLASRPSLFSDT